MKQNKDVEVKLEEAVQEEARLEEEAEQREPSKITQTGGVQNTLPTGAIIKGSNGMLDGSFLKRPPSSLKHRKLCPVCQHCNVKPFQVLKYKQMNDVLRMSHDSDYNYLCLSGIVYDA